MASFVLDDVLRRYREQMDLLSEQVAAPLRDQQRVFEKLITPMVRATLKVNEEFVRTNHPHDAGVRRLVELAEQLTKDVGAAHARLMERLPTHPSFSSAGLMTDELARMSISTSVVMQEFQRVATIPAEFARAMERTSVLPAATAQALSDIQRMIALPSWPALSAMSRLAKDAYPSSIQAAMKATLAEINRVPAPTATMTSDGVMVGADLVEAADINAQLAEALGHAQSFGDARFRLFFAQLIGFVRRAPKPLATAVLTMVGVILLMVLEGEVQYYAGELLAPVRRIVVRKVRELTGQIPAQHRRPLRIVTARDVLNVRRYPRMSNSAILGKVYFGTVVVSIRTQKDWTLIEYAADETVVRGWTYTRYLQRVDH